MSAFASFKFNWPTDFRGRLCLRDDESAHKVCEAVHVDSDYIGDNFLALQIYNSFSQSLLGFKCSPYMRWLWLGLLILAVGHAALADESMGQ